MILVDSSVWIDHLRREEPELSSLLGAQQVLTHPFIIGEIALGSLRQRTLIVSDLRNLPAAVEAGDDEVLALIEGQSLHGRGIGYIDVHLLAATLLTPGTKLWTRDRRLRDAAQDLGLAAIHS
ncbi:type II toxin-antitoxin system VapC family toxin [Novosphingobium sp.]|uniref:type II toxin-antitoxin system VapC family toxin n=1 Tax=Novosphingobium sp. TaxID=1874826 RepID=UPI001D94E555|nr:type II toxin-antitoxin system VapC family toxin [Novosphingobium sp.]MBX9665419.1 type II toxin-antitoxin system VapC family toxin [Novosphingobium sp.]